VIWFAVFVLCAVSFVFAGMEAGLLSISPVRLRHHAKLRTRGAKRLERLLEHPERLLVTVLIVTNVADIVALLLATQLLVARSGRAGYWIAGFAAVPVHLFALGVLPKSLFRRFPFRALAALSGVLELAALLLGPIVKAGGSIGRLLVSRRTTDRARLFAAREELKQVAVQSEREGSLTSAERAMIHNVVDFRRVRSREVMVPLANCITVTPETSVPDVLQLSGTSGVDRFPVIAHTGEAVGLINVFDLLFNGRDPQPLPRYMRRIITAGENEPAYRLIRRLRAARLGLAAIVDAEKKLIGIATDEQLIKRLVQSA
jgi:CBS domain containing-hemolysin-like protein